MWQHCKNTFVRLRRALVIPVIFLVIGSGLSPLISGSASAATISTRSVTLGSGVISTVTTYAVAFVPGTTAAIQGLKLQACTAAIGTCTAPSGLSLSSVAGGTVSGGWTTSTNFTTDLTGANDCTASVSLMCAKRTQATAETVAGGARTVTFTTITNPNGTSCATINCTFFLRITTYSTNTWTGGSIVDTGTVASSTTQTLTVNATIAEALVFCIGATTIDDGTTAPPACAGVSGTSLSLGTLTSADSSVSPVSSTTQGDGNNGIADLSTNAANGASVAYDAIQQSGSNHNGTLKVAGSTCSSGSINSDTCINAIGTTQAALIAGTEDFGMTIAAVNCASTTAYSCSFGAGTYHLTRNANYDGTGANTYPTDTNLVAGTTNAGYAWDESGTAQTIASSATVLDNEALILKFAATPSIVTPAGSYTAKADFVATPIF